MTGPGYGIEWHRQIIDLDFPKVSIDFTDGRADGYKEHNVREAITGGASIDQIRV